MTAFKIPRYVPGTPSKLKTQIAGTETLDIQIGKPRRRSSVSSTNSSHSSDEDRSLVQAHCLVGKVRARLRHEVQQPVGNLRRLVGHVNVLDEIMDIICDDELQGDSEFTNFGILEQEQSNSSKMLIDDDDEWNEDGSGESESTTDDSGLVINIRELRSAPQRPAPQGPLLIGSKS